MDKLNTLVDDVVMCQIRFIMGKVNQWNGTDLLNPTTVSNMNLLLTQPPSASALIILSDSFHPPNTCLPTYTETDLM